MKRRLGILTAIVGIVVLGVVVGVVRDAPGKRVPMEAGGMREPGRSCGPPGAVIVAQAVTQERVTTGALRIETTPPGAVIYVNGKEVGKSPVTISGLAPGRMKVRAELSGYRSEVRTVEVMGGLTVQVYWMLHEVGSKGRLYVEARPRDARVRIVDGDAPYRRGMELEPGEHEIEITKEGYRPVRRKVEIAAGEDLVLALTFAAPVATTTPRASACAGSVRF